MRRYRRGESFFNFRFLPSQEGRYIIGEYLDLRADEQSPTFTKPGPDADFQKVETSNTIVYTNQQRVDG